MQNYKEFFYGSVIKINKIGFFWLGEVVIYKFFYILKFDGEGVEGCFYYRFYRLIFNVIVDSLFDKLLIFV